MAFLPNLPASMKLRRDKLRQDRLLTRQRRINYRNTQCGHVVKIIACLDFEQNRLLLGRQ
jgi:hypothetical protein